MYCKPSRCRGDTYAELSRYRSFPTMQFAHSKLELALVCEIVLAPVTAEVSMKLSFGRARSTWHIHALQTYEALCGPKFFEI